MEDRGQGEMRPVVCPLLAAPFAVGVVVEVEGFSPAGRRVALQVELVLSAAVAAQHLVLAHDAVLLGCSRHLQRAAACK